MGKALLGLSKSRMWRGSNFLSLLLVLLFCSANFLPHAGLSRALAQDSVFDEPKESETQYVKPTMLVSSDALVPGGKIRLAVRFDLLPHWHIYYKEAGDAGMPTTVDWQLPKGFEAGPLLWEKPARFSDSGIVTYGYETSTIVASDISIPVDLSQDKKVTLKADLKWLSCKDICIPGEGAVSMDLPVGKTASPTKDSEALGKLNESWMLSQLDKKTDKTDENKDSAIASDSKGLLYYFAFAIVGGFILNFMPCVLPVIAIKVMSFLEQAEEEPARVRLLGLVFSSGIISAFLVLAIVVLAVRAAGESVGWGFQFQYPGFIIVMSVIVLLLALSLFGLFYFSFDAGQAKLDQLAQREGLSGSFFKGVLATTLSTPCTAPFLGTALGFAFAQPAWVVLGIFFLSGLGMSLPYVILTAFPALMKRLPKPGDWMEKFKESMGFVLLATVIWLLSILGSQVGAGGVMWVSFFLLAVSLSAWIVGRFTDLASSSARKLKVWAVAIAISGAGFYLCVMQQPVLMASLSGQALPKEKIAWQPFSKAALESSVEAGNTVFLDFTADWCLTCKANESLFLNSDSVVGKMKELNVLTMKADWTSKNPEITTMLSGFKRSGVPLYVVYSPGKLDNPQVLPEIISEQIVLDALQKAGPSSL